MKCPDHVSEPQPLPTPGAPRDAPFRFRAARRRRTSIEYVEGPHRYQISQPVRVQGPAGLVDLDAF